MHLQTTFRLQAALATIVAAAAIAVAACGGGGSNSLGNGVGCARALAYGGGGGGGSNCGVHASPTPAASAAAVGLLLSGENPVTVATYGQVTGFFNGTVGNPPSGSGVVHLTAGQNVQFTNTEAGGGLPHTASFIQAWSGSFPGSPTIPSTAAAAGASISSSGFSTGNLNPGQQSAIYTTGGAGMFIFGCAYHYGPFAMRTVIIVM